MGDWSNLTFDLLRDIVMRFETFEDLVYFSVVCRLWNHFASKVKHEFNVKRKPWLLLAENTRNNPDCLRKVYNPVNNKCYQLKIPQTIGCRSWGSAYGWVVTYNNDLDLHLFNPLTKAQKSLPPISCLPLKFGPHVSIRPHDFAEDYFDRLMKHFIQKALVLKIGEDDIIVFVSYFFSRRKLAFARPGDQSWTSIDQPGCTPLEEMPLSSCVVDVVCHGAQLLILYEDASVGFLDVSDLSGPHKLIFKDLPQYPLNLSNPLGIKAKEYLPAPSSILDDFQESMYGLYLVESSGNLFMVLRNRYDLPEEDDEDGRVYDTSEFKVYQLDFNNKEWSQVHRIGDVALFVGNNSSMTVVINGVGNLKSNSIYYTDDEFNSWDQPKTFGGEDMGVFHLDTQSCEDIYRGSDRNSKIQTPLWFIPEFDLKVLGHRLLV